jgi:hypothetical protein
MYSDEQEQEHRAREPTKATTTRNSFNEAVRRWSGEGGRRKIRGKQRQQQPPSPVISNAPRASPSFSLSLSLSLARARPLFSRGPAVLSCQAFDPCVGKTEPPKRHFCALLKQGQTFNFVKIFPLVW